MELKEVHSVRATATSALILDITVVADGEETRVSYGLSPTDPHGLAPSLREWIEENTPVILPYEEPAELPIEEKRALMPMLERWRVNTIIDLEQGLREKINAAIEAMPEPQRTISKNKLADVQLFSRLDPLFELIGRAPEVGKTPEDIDAMWEAGITLN